ncbi:MAG: prepilin-type N-terminal cleavage/methylation domain-containing protein [Chrysiogenetes bacterium]|nr:prepilin-type N-terminal cleavage/methylation domain-containing protein [Chrysiogenetes bacterium]
MKCPAPKRRARERGFTFIEVTAALAILALALVVLLDGVRQGTMAFMQTRDLATAQTLARRVMTETLLNDELPLDDEIDRGDFGSDYPNYEWQVEYKVNENIEDLRQLAPDLTKTLFLLKVKVLWDDDGLEQEYELRSVRLYDVEEETQP